MNKNSGQILPVIVFFICIALGVGSIAFSLRTSKHQEAEVFAVDGAECEYPENCTTSDGEQGVHTCTGTIQDGTCKYKSGVDPNCSDCVVQDSGGGSGNDNPSDCGECPCVDYGEDGTADGPCSGITDESKCWTHSGSGCAWISGSCTCNRSSSGPKIEGTCSSFRNISDSDVQVSIAKCKEEYWPDKSKQQCQQDADRGVGCASETITLEPGDSYSLSPTATCGIWQLDAHGGGWNCADTGCNWNDSQCSIPTLSCNSLTTSASTITLGSSATVTAQVSNYGLISYAKVGSLTERVYSEERNENGLIKILAQGNQSISESFTPEEAGIYVFEVNAFDSNQCNYLCSPGGIVYQNTSGPNQCFGGDINNWEQAGSCSSGCVTWITVEEAPTVTKEYSCNSLAMSATPSLGTTVTFSCSAGGKDASTANFRVYRGTTLLNNAQAQAAGFSVLSAQITNGIGEISASFPSDSISSGTNILGDYKVQCQVCTADNSCTEWGQAQTGN